MTQSELNAMTVLQLRKVAKENHVVLGAGIDKATIVAKIYAAMSVGEQQSMLPGVAAGKRRAVKKQAAEEEAPVPAPEEAADEAPAEAESDSVPETPSAEENPAPAFSANAETDVAEEAPAAPAPAETEEAAPAEASEAKYQAAWHSPDAAQFGAHPAHQPGFAAQRSAWQNTSPSGRPLTPEQRQQPYRPNSSAPRFGPGPAVRHAPAETEPAAGVRPGVSPLPDRRVGFAGSGGFGPRPAGTFVTAASPAPVSAAPVPDAPAAAPAGPGMQEPPQAPVQDASALAPTLEELLASGDFEEGSGILELHPDGYGFLRASNFLPSSRDIYVSMAQIRRFSLRTGDLVEGKIRPQREGDKYAALLYIDTINGVQENEAFSRPVFDELTPTYPNRRISLELKGKASIPAMRLIDLIAPLGFGQRGLILCPPDTGKRELLQSYAKVITTNFPDVTVLMMLIDLNPEDVTQIRETVSCPVLASTFDQSPEAHLRLTEMVLERAMRLVEQQKDVVILADSLTRLAKIYTTAAVQQGRSLPGMVNPSSLLRAKKLFGAARACKEGGSLTVIATMDIATGSRVDDSVVEEFKGTANMELVLDQSVARAGVSPAINLARSYTKNADLLLDNRQKEGLSLIRQMLGSTSSAVAIPQLLSMMEKTATNKELLLKMKDWFALMNR